MDGSIINSPLGGNPFINAVSEVTLRIRFRHIQPSGCQTLTFTKIVVYPAMAIIEFWQRNSSAMSVTRRMWIVLYLWSSHILHPTTLQHLQPRSLQLRSGLRGSVVKRADFTIPRGCGFESHLGTVLRYPIFPNTCYL